MLSNGGRAPASASPCGREDAENAPGETCTGLLDKLHDTVFRSDERHVRFHDLNLRIWLASSCDRRHQQGSGRVYLTGTVQLQSNTSASQSRDALPQLPRASKSSGFCRQGKRADIAHDRPSTHHRAPTIEVKSHEWSEEHVAVSEHGL